MLHRTRGRMALGIVLLGASACSGGAERGDPRLSQPLPPPGSVSAGPVPSQPLSVPPQAGAQDIVLNGAAYAAGGDGRFPPGSTMTVRLYDADLGDPNDWAAEQSYQRSGSMPWPYTMRFREEALRGLRRPVIAAQIAGPDGQLIYRSERAVPLSPGGAEDLPMVPATAATGSAVAGGQGYGIAPAARETPMTYGIPDYDTGYGTPTYDTPVYPGQSYQPPSLSGPPSNGVF